MNNCCLCTSLGSVNNDEFWNKPLTQTTHFAVLPSLGSLVEGWLLIVPKRHVICMGALPAELVTELHELKMAAASVLKRRYGHACAFEHGPHDVDRCVGCGVDHAHLHLVPIQFDLARAAAPFMPPDVSWERATFASCRAAFEANRDYLYVEQPLDEGYIAVHDALGSQILRRAIATHVGMSDQFNWREYPHIAVVSKTVQALADSITMA